MLNYFGMVSRTATVSSLNTFSLTAKQLAFPVTSYVEVSEEGQIMSAPNMKYIILSKQNANPGVLNTSVQALHTTVVQPCSGLAGVVASSSYICRQTIADNACSDKVDVSRRIAEGRQLKEGKRLGSPKRSLVTC